MKTRRRATARPVPAQAYASEPPGPGWGHAPEPPPADQADVLATSPFSGDLEADLAAGSRGPKLPGPTFLLGMGVLLAVGFLGGIEADQNWGSSGSSATASLPGAAAARGSGGLAAQGPPGGTAGSGPGTAASGTIGTIKTVSGGTIYVQTSSGIVKVKTTGTTKVTISGTGKASELKPGASVVVQGSQDTTGTVTAQTLTQR